MWFLYIYIKQINTDMECKKQLIYMTVKSNHFPVFYYTIMQSNCHMYSSLYEVALTDYKKILFVILTYKFKSSSKSQLD